MRHRKLEFLTRLGFAARGILYVMIGWLALKAGRAEDAAGVLEYLNGGGGKLILGFMAIGFAGYGLWRLADAALDGEGRGSGIKAGVLRLGAAGSGLVHLGLFYFAARLALSQSEGGSSADSSREGARTALDLPGGWTLVLIAAFVLLLVGGYQLVKAGKGSFLRHLDGRAAGSPWVRLAGRIGYGARGLVFLVMAWFLGRAAMREDAGEAGGMGEALASLPSTIQLAAALGLLLFGLFSLVEARHRRIVDPVGGRFDL